MRFDLRNPAFRDLLGGTFLVLTGLGTAFYAVALLPFGILSRMGSGYFPFLLGAVLVLLGAILLVTVWAEGRAADDDPNALRFEAGPCVSILAAVLLFALLARPFGLVPAIVATTLVATALDRNLTRTEAVILSAVLSGLAVLVFKVLLGLQFILFRWPF